MLNSHAAALVATVCLLGTSACSPGSRDAPPPSASVSTEQAGEQAGADRFPDVTQVSASLGGDGTWSFDVTMTSPYDTPQRYADGWRVTDGKTVLGEMTLGHDHASEQPFTRTQSGVSIPDSVTTVTVQGRDQKNGYGGRSMSVKLSR